MYFTKLLIKHICVYLSLLTVHVNNILLSNYFLIITGNNNRCDKFKLHNFHAVAKIVPIYP